MQEKVDFVPVEHTDWIFNVHLLSPWVWWELATLTGAVTLVGIRAWRRRRHGNTPGGAHGA